MKLILIIKNDAGVHIGLKRGGKVIDNESLTIGRDLDNMLIIAIDKLLAKNRIDRLSLETLEIQGKMRAEAVSSMIIRTIKSAIET